MVAAAIRTIFPQSDVIATILDRQSPKVDTRLRDTATTDTSKDVATPELTTS
jgi:hypothetical protein